MPEITYTPNGIPRAPGYINPDNPYDTGRQGEKNAELNQGRGGTPYGWDRELQQWVSGPGSSNDSPPGGGGGGGGGNPMDAYTRQLQSVLEAQGAAQRAGGRSDIQQLLIAFGLVPEGFNDQLGALDETTRALIKKNTETGISGYARMLQDKRDKQRSMLAALSRTGLRRSGAKGFLGRRAQLDFDRAQMDAIGALQKEIGGKYSAIAEGDLQRKLQLMQALFAQQNSAPFGASAQRTQEQQADPFTNQQNPQVLAGWAQAAQAQNESMNQLGRAWQANPPDWSNVLKPAPTYTKQAVSALGQRGQAMADFWKGR